MQTFVQGSKGRKTLAVQTGGITCLGPQYHSLITTGAAGNIQLDPAIAWNIQPPKEVRIRIGMQSNYSVFIGVNFSINSQIGNMTWTLYQGSRRSRRYPSRFLRLTILIGLRTYLAGGYGPGGYRLGPL